MSKSGKARVLSSSAQIKVTDYILNQEVLIGEVDSFSASSTTQINKVRSIGTAIETAYLKYGGYELTFKGGKVDWNLARKIHAQDLILSRIGYFPKFNIIQQIKFYDGTVEQYTYNDAIIYGYTIDINQTDGAEESFKGFSPTRGTAFGQILPDLGESSLQMLAAIAGQVKETALIHLEDRFRR